MSPKEHDKKRYGRIPAAFFMFGSQLQGNLPKNTIKTLIFFKKYSIIYKCKLYLGI